MVSGATDGNLEVPGALLNGDSYWYQVLRVLAVVVSLTELLWIKRCIVPVRAEIWAGSRLALIFSSTKSGEKLTIFCSLYSIASVLLLLSLLFRVLTFLVSCLNRTRFHSLMSETFRKSSCNWDEVNYDVNTFILRT